MSRKVISILSLLIVLILVVSVVQPAYTSNDGKMRVWVEFSPGKSAKVENALNALGAEFHYRFEDLNSFVVTVPEQALAGLRNNPNVVSIEEDAIRYAATQDVPYGIDMVQARDIWDSDRDGVVDIGAPTGSGINVCIIDSGIFAAHEDFTGVNIYGGYTNIPGAVYYDDNFGHGTHVAGTIAAQSNTLGVVGVTPGDVNLFIVKVFGDDGLWAYSSSLVDAANRCANAGAKIISMSLGGPTKNKTEERAFNSLYAAGILSIAAAGNDGTTAYNYPASYSSVVSVAAIDENKAKADFSQYNIQVELAAPGVGVMSTVPFINVASISVEGTTFNGHPVEFAALNTVSGPLVNGGLCASTGPWSGKVVLCQRGDIAFYDKVMNVQTSGGVAAVIYNNTSGDLFATLGDGNSSAIPSIGLTQEQGATLLTKIDQTATVQNTSTPDASGYEAWDGTSMATPHVSGIAALIWSVNPNWTNLQIRNALTSTAEDLGATGRDVEFGFGLIQAFDALVSLGWNPSAPTPTPTTFPTDPTPTPVPTNTPTPVSQIMNLTVTTDKTTYSNGQTVYITVSTKNTDGTPIVGASVSVIIRKSTTVYATGSSTTGTTGEVTFTYRIKTRTTGTGTMTVDATASAVGYPTESETTTFVIQ